MEILIIDSQELKEIILDSFFSHGLYEFQIKIEKIESSGLRDEFKIYLSGEDDQLRLFIRYYNGEYII